MVLKFPLQTAQKWLKQMLLPVALVLIVFAVILLNALRVSGDIRAVFLPLLLTLTLIALLFVGDAFLHHTEKRELDLLVQKDLNRIAFLRLTTHQLGMPLATFKWWLELLREHNGLSPTDTTEACDQLQEGVHRLDGIINSLLDATQLKGDTFISVSGARTNFVDAFQEVQLETWLQLQHRKQKIVLECPETDLTLPVERKLLVGVLRELIENASFYSPEGGEVTVRARKTYSHVQVDVEDHGCGIPPEELSMIFEKFARASNASRYKPAGSGLGLYISRGIIERAGGTMWLRSALNKGTTVSFTLPIV